MNEFFEWCVYGVPGYAQATYAMIIAAVVGAAGTAYGASQNKKASKANQKNQEAYNEAVIANEAEARELFDKFISDYNSSKEKLEEGQSLQQYVEQMVSTLDNPQLERAYRQSKQKDWAQAQIMADQAMDQNVSAFNRIVDDVAGGDYQNFIKARNKSILGEDVESLYSEARRLQSPNIAAGSIKRDAEGNVIEGQRGDKFEFGVSVTAQKEFNDRMFTKSRTAIEDDRAAAQRQQEKAISFLPMLDYSGFAANNVVRPFQDNQLRAQLAILQSEAQLAGTSMAAATGMPMAPSMMNANAGDAMMMQGTQLAAGALAQLYKDNKTTGTTNAESRANTHAYSDLGKTLNSGNNNYF